MTDAEAIASRVPDGSTVLVFGDRGPDVRSDRIEVAERVAMLVSDRGGTVTTLASDPAAIHELSADLKFGAAILSGCRCMDCTIVAWTLCSRHVEAGGIIAVLDTNPMAAWVGRHQGHGPQRREYGVATRMALSRLELLDGLHARWALEVDHYDPSDERGGTMILRRKF